MARAIATGCDIFSVPVGGGGVVDPSFPPKATSSQQLGIHKMIDPRPVYALAPAAVGIPLNTPVYVYSYRP